MMAERQTWDELMGSLEGKDYALQSLMVLRYGAQLVLEQLEKDNALPLPGETTPRGLQASRIEKERREIASLDRAIRILEGTGR